MASRRVSIIRTGILSVWDCINKTLESIGCPEKLRSIIISWFKRSQEVGKYLGVEIIHGRKTKCKFSHIMDKVQNRLAGWKANCLSMAERATLIQSVCSSMPLYHMQHNMLPKSVINQVEKLERAFLWVALLRRNIATILDGTKSALRSVRRSWHPITQRDEHGFLLQACLATAH
ncbi:ribonuclease H [Senna tora]|uniref:Ribonuclease H n=1 Tax=Senna tora TaxID=362788 RepID=A0A835CF76_9FABA|nr:ribonuclease H [Senna tora]